MAFGRIGIAFVVLLVFASFAFAEVQDRYSVGGLELTRTLTTRPIGNYDSSTGATKMQYESVITLRVFNPGPLDRQNVSIEENLNYLPPNARLSFNLQPNSDGRTARWELPVLAAGQEFAVWFSLPASVPEGAVSQLGPMQVHANRPPARLVAPTAVGKGDAIVLRLRTGDGLPLPGAAIEVTDPQGGRQTIATDQTGATNFIAAQGGFYTYKVMDYDVGFIPSTESRVLVIPNVGTAGALIVVAPAAEQKNEDMGAQVGRLWPLGLGLLMVGIIAMGLYGSLASGPGGTDERMPPAPATRPITERGVEHMKADSGSGLGDAVWAKNTTSASATASGSSPASATGGETGTTLAAGAPLASGGARGSARPSIPSVPSGTATDPQAIYTRTRDMIARRRQVPGGETSESGEGLDGAGAEDATGAAALRAGAEESRFTEETVMESGEPEEKEGGESLPKDGKPEWDVPESARAARPEPPPRWLTDEDMPEGESSEIDEDAIRKTIEELEQLRRELASRSAEGRKPASIRKPAAAEMESEREEGSEEEESGLRRAGEAGEEASEEKETSEAEDSSAPRIIPIRPEEEEEIPRPFEPPAPKPARKREVDGWEGMRPSRAKQVRKVVGLKIKRERKAVREVRSAPIRNTKKGVRHQSERAVNKAVGRSSKSKKKGRR